MGIEVFEFLNQVLRKPLVFQLINGLRGQIVFFKLVQAKIAQAIWLRFLLATLQASIPVSCLTPRWNFDFPTNSVRFFELHPLSLRQVISDYIVRSVGTETVIRNIHLFITVFNFNQLPLAFVLPLTNLVVQSAYISLLLHYHLPSDFVSKDSNKFCPVARLKPSASERHTSYPSGLWQGQLLAVHQVA